MSNNQRTRNTRPATQRAQTARPPVSGQASRTTRTGIDARPRFTREELDRFKAIILEMREEVLNDLRALQDVASSERTSDDIDLSHDHGASFMERSFETAIREHTALLMNRQSKLLGYLQAALRRIEHDEYGYCRSCGELIDPQRLEAVPHTELCMRCKSSPRHRPRAA